VTYSKGALESNLVPLDALNGLGGDGGLSILQHGGDINRLPGYRSLRWVSIQVRRNGNTRVVHKP
jgi:hypothetical protein